MRTLVSAAHGRVEVKFASREPFVMWDKGEVMELIIAMCQALHRAWPERPKKVETDKT